MTGAIDKITFARLREGGDIHRRREIFPIAFVLAGRPSLESTEYVG